MFVCAKLYGIFSFLTFSVKRGERDRYPDLQPLASKVFDNQGFHIGVCDTFLCAVPMDKVRKQAAVGTLSKEDLENVMPAGILPYGWQRMTWNEIVSVIDNLSSGNKNMVTLIVRERIQNK